MGRKNKIPKNRDIEDIVYGTQKTDITAEQEKTSIAKKEPNFKDTLKFKNFCIRKDNQIKEEEKQITLLRAISKLQDEER